MSRKVRYRLPWARIIVLLALATLGIVLSIYGYYMLLARENGVVAAQFEADTSLRVREIERRFGRDLTSVYGMGRFLTNSQPGTRDDFRAVFRAIESRASGDRDPVVFIWAPRVSASQRGEHEAAEQKAGSPQYRIIEASEDGKLIARSEKPREFFPIQYVEPQEANRELQGFDLLSLPDCAAAMTRALDRPLGYTGVASLVGRKCVLVLLPNLRGASISDTPEQRRQKLIGYLVVAVPVDTMLENALAGFSSPIDVRVYDDSAPQGRQLVSAYDFNMRRAGVDISQTLPGQGVPIDSISTSLKITGRQWAVECVPTREFVEQQSTSRSSHVTLLLGFTITGLVLAYAHSLMGQTAKVEQLVELRTGELQRANESLAYERFLLNTLLDYSLDYIYFKDNQSRFIRASKALADYFGLTHPAHAVGKTDSDVFDADRAAQYLADEQAVMRTGIPVVNKEEEQVTPDGQRKWVLTTKVCLRNAEGQAVGTFGISRDITVRKQAEETLRHAKEAAEAASRAKSDFLANMSHEIRTPMNAIIGMTELVLDTELTHSQRDYLKLVLQSSESLLTILNDILDFSKIEAGKLELQHAVFDVRELVGDTVKSLAYRAHTKRLELLCQVQRDVPHRLVGDGGRLRQVIVNLVGNAIKFTETGEVFLKVTCRERWKDNVRLDFSVRDTGIGIPSEKRKLIFGAFEQADTSKTRRYGGTGLGLAICSQLVKLMGGEIGVESEAGHGSHFHFSLSFAVSEEEVVEEVIPASLRGARVLVLDDNSTSCEILEGILGEWQVDASFVKRPEEAKELLLEAQRVGRPFAVVLADADMPQCNGFTFAEQIRQDERFGCALIMMLSLGDRPGETAHCEHLGVATYLFKPIKQSELLEAFFVALGVSSGEAAPAESAAAAQARQIPALRVLLAEDSLVNQKLAIGLLEQYGHTVVVANDGKEAVEAYEEQTFDLVLMDVQMPELDGFEATAIIRAREKQSGTRLPIIAMTAHAMKGDRERCLAAGMDDYVPKPVRAQDLFRTIRAVLNAR